MDADERERKAKQAAYRAERTQILKLFGEKLAIKRDPEVISQTKFAEKARLHRNQIYYLERGQREPSLLTLLILAEALGVKPGELLEGLPVPQERKPARKRKRGQRKQRAEE